MKFFGQNFLSLSYQTGISFDLNLSINNLSGISNIGFSGPQENLTTLKPKNYHPEATYIFRSATSNTLANILSPGQFEAYGTDTLYINNQIFFTISPPDWVYEDFQTNANNFIIPVNSILYFEASTDKIVSVGGDAIVQKYYEDKFEFKFNKGNILDPEGRNIYTYQSNESINISGDINNNFYSYYINKAPACLNGNTNLNAISGFYINTTGCEVDANINVYGIKPKYNFDLENVFYIKSGRDIKGSISTDKSFKIYSGAVTIPTGFYVKSISSNIDSSGYIFIDGYDASHTQVESEKEYFLKVVLYTNFGNIAKNFNITGSYSGFLDLNLTLNDSSSNLVSELGSYNDNIKYLTFNVQSGDLRSNPIEFDKILNLEFSYYSGKTGNLFLNIPGSGYKNINVTGFISGSGYLGKTDLILTGYNFLSGTQVTGRMTGVPYDPFIITGFVSKKIDNIIFTGNYFNQTFTTTNSTNLTGFTYDGIVNYNDYVYPLNRRNFSAVSTVAVPNTLDSSNSFIDSNQSGTISLVSLPYQSNHSLGIFSTGRVFVYTGRNAAGALTLAKIYSGLNGDRSFGIVIHKSQTGDSFLIGSERRGSQGNSGRFYICENYNQNLISAKLIDFSGKNFNSECDGVIAGDTVCIGIGSSFDNTGSVNIYQNTGAILSLRQTLTGYSYDGRFGKSLAINQNKEILSINARLANSSGEVYIFTGDNFNYSLLNTLNRSGEVSYPSLGGLAQSMAFNNAGNLFAIGGSLNGPSLPGIFYIFTGNKNNKFAQVYYATGSISAGQLGAKVKFNSSGDKLLVTNLLGTLYGHIYTGANRTWTLYDTILGGKEIITLPNNEEIYYRIQSNSIDTIYNINYSGYFSGSQIATGIINKTSNYLISGLITGFKYFKSFENTFQVETGYYTSNTLTGITGINYNNEYSKYMSLNRFIDKTINNLYINIKSKNYNDLEDTITGKLTLIGSNFEKTQSGVIYKYITGG